MFKKLFSLFLAFTICTSLAFSQVKIIFDTDHGGDADDLGALVMLHNLHNRGECELACSHGVDYRTICNTCRGCSEPLLRKS
jgi:hypothetical protein